MPALSWNSNDYTLFMNQEGTYKMLFDAWQILLDDSLVVILETMKFREAGNEEAMHSEAA